MAREKPVEPELDIVQPPPKWRRIKVIDYKIATSQGQKIEGQFVELPPDEAVELVAQGRARHADP